jgi:hypothetical protein
MTPQTHNTAVAVEELLLDAGMGQDAELRRVLLAVGSLADLPAPEPTGQLAALLAAGTRGVPWKVPQHSSATESALGDELGRRRLRAHRPTVVGLALVAGMGMGVGTVAASSTDPAHTGSHSVQQLLEDWSPSWTIRTPQAAAPGPLQMGSDDAAVRQDRSGPAGGSSTPGGDAPVAPQTAEESWEASSPQPPPARGREVPGDVPAADGRDRTGEPESAAEQDVEAMTERTGAPDSGTKNAADTERSGQGPGNAPTVPGEAAQEAEGQGAGPAAGREPVPGAKWLEKFVR